MVINKEEHKAFLLELLKQMTYPGHLIDLVYEVRNAIEYAKVDENA